MSAVRSAFASMGFRDVRTILASGNVIFEGARPGPALERKVSRGLEKALGFPVAVILRSARELQAIVRSEPFRADPSGPKDQRYVTFLDGKGKALSPARLPAPPQWVHIVKVAPGEIFSVVLLSRGGRTPDLMRYLDRALGPRGTTRNWRTVLKIAQGGPS